MKARWEGGRQAIPLPLNSRCNLLRSSLTPHTAGIVEAVLRAAIAPPKSNRHPADALAHRIDEWSPDGAKHVDTLAFIGNFAAAQAAWEEYRKSKPYDHLTWRHGTRVIQERLWSDKFAERA